MRGSLLFVVCGLLLNSCNQNSNRAPEVGEIDTTAIAQDTSMQKGFESSYEYAKTLVVHEHLVYDIRAYGGPASSGEFAIIRRGADNKSDTVVIEKRNGAIEDAFLKENHLNIIVRAGDSTRTLSYNLRDLNNKPQTINNKQ
jgi:hypothetical protein